MMRTRIAVNLLFFALLGVVLAIWAAGSLVHIDALERPFPVTVDFASSPGLHSDLQVTYLGVQVGRVGSVDLRPGKVAVRLELERGAEIPANTGAQVLRKSAIGEPYIDLTAPSVPSSAHLKAGDHIPVSRTRATVDYKHLFDGLGATLKAVDPADARVLVHELAAGLVGRGDSLHDLIGDTHQLTATLAANAGLLDELSIELTELTHTLAAHRAQLASGVDDLAAFTASVNASRRDLQAVLQQGPGFTKRVNALLQTARPGLDCLLGAAAEPGPPIFTPAATASVHHILTMLPTFQALLDDTAVVTPQVTYLRATALFSIAGPRAAAEYARPTPKPVTPRVNTCPASATGGTNRTAATAPAGPGAAPARTGTSTAAPEQAVRPVSSTGSSASRLLPLLPIGLAAAVLLATAARSTRALWALRRRNRPSR
ncbi:MCE family protein [Actinomadura scrupuli]|uniref:MCE family protein n=1 Tax=Actinomadura scrupuli TaxID=559629 RepID=UPI003D99CD0B